MDAADAQPQAIEAEYDETKLVQIIGSEGELMPMDHIKEALVKWDVVHKGFDYFVVAILGCQSSGKSTLLNLLFGTSFPVMEASEGRTQTTQGVWMGRAKALSEKEETILVFDVEGTDSRERGEQHASFERKTSLFSLALAEVLLINMWHNDVGRYTAGNVALLKVVFEMNLQLFQKAGDPKKLLLFVIRDHVPRETPLEKLKGIVMKDMKNIWDGLVKPDHLKDSRVEDVFEFQFTALPHKILAEEDFVKDVQQLRRRFVDGSAPDFILSSEDIHRKDIPADGFATFTANVWHTIRDNKDLNIPTQKQMLSIYRCDEISSEAVKNFQKVIAPYRKTLDNGELVEDFGEIATKAFQEMLAFYDKQATRYQTEIAAQKREALVNNASDMLYALFTKQVQKILENAVEFFNKVLADSLPKDNTAAKEFTRMKDSVLHSTQEYFSKRVADCLVPDLKWNYDNYVNELKTAIAKNVETVKHSQLDKLTQEMKTMFSSMFLKHLDRILESPDATMWSKIRSKYEEGKQKAVEKFQQRLKDDFESSDEETEQRVSSLEQTLYSAMRDRLVEKTKYLNFIMSKKFEELFNQDEQGLPRRWKPADDVAKVFLESRGKAEEVLELFSVIRLQPEQDKKEYLDPEADLEDLPKESILLSSDEAKVIRDKFYKEAQSSYLQAQRDQENVSTTAHVPVYMIILLIVLGFDEFLHIISSPLLLFLTIIIGGMLYVTYLLGMTAPALRFVESGFHTLVTQVQHVLHAQLEQRQQQANNNNNIRRVEDPNKAKAE